jgi:AAA+ superfamily predicted ATPase
MFWFIILFCITYTSIIIIYNWYYDIDNFAELEEDIYSKNFSNIFMTDNTNKYILPVDSDNDELITITLKDIQKSNETNEDNTHKNIVQLKKIINKTSIENINDLIKIADYYEKNILNNNYNEKIIDNLYNYGELYFTINLTKIYNIKGPLIKLKKMVGLTKIKNDIIDLILYYLTHNENNNNLLHMTIEGSSGCGKTKLAKIISQLLVKLNILKTEKITYAKSTDLIGEYVGQTGAKTQKLIDSALNGVLFIDEAYGIGDSKGINGNFGVECINVLNQNLSDNKHKFICIIAGYTKELEKMFFSLNSGLKRRFPFRFVIEKYTYQELMNIFVFKIYKLKLKIDKNINLEEFFKNNYKEFIYFGGDIETFIQNINYAKIRRTIGNYKLCNSIIIEDFNKALDKLKNNNKKSKSKSKSKSKIFIYK